MRSSLTASPLTRQHVGDDAFCCAIVSVPPDPVLANRTRVFRLPGGTIAFQTHATAGPARYGRGPSDRSPPTGLPRYDICA